jgi:hypothetical protein
MKIPALLAPALCLALAGCDDVALSVVCPQDPQPSVVVGVLDPGTGESAAREAHGFYTVAGVTDSLRHVLLPDGEPQLMAFGPPGVYQVRVIRPGHTEWVKADLQVQPAECGPATVRLVATLERAL